MSLILGGVQSASAIIEVVKICHRGYCYVSNFIRSMKKMGHDVADLEQHFEEEKCRMWTFARANNLVVDGNNQSDAALLGRLPPLWVDLVAGRFSQVRKHLEEAEQIVSRYTESPPPAKADFIPRVSTLSLEEQPMDSPSIMAAQVTFEKNVEAIQQSAGLKLKFTWARQDKRKLDDTIDKLAKDNDALWNLIGPNLWNMMFDAVSSKLSLDDLEIFTARTWRRENGAQLETERQSYERRMGEQFAARKYIATLDGESTDQKFSRELDGLGFAEILHADLPEQRTRTPTTYCSNGTKKEVLVEWKEWNHDLITREEIISRVSDVVAILNSPPSFLQNVLQSPGFFEDNRCNKSGNTWIGIVYYTDSFGYRPKIRTMRELLTRSCPGQSSGQDIWKPPLGDRFRLAHRLAETLLAVHNCGWLHKGLRPENVVFFSSAKSLNDPYLLGWEYSRSAKRGQKTEPVIAWDDDVELYQHPLWFEEQSPDDDKAKFRIEFDQYQLGCLLLEIGLWCLIGDLKRSTMRSFTGPKWREYWKEYLESKTRILEIEMGKIYADVVLNLLRGLDADGRELEYWDAVVLRLSRCQA